MPRDYAAMTTLVVTKLQSSGTADFSVAEVDYQIEEGLKELATYKPHIIEVPFKIESRYGTASTTSASNLVDTPKGQFLATDPDNEKVIHNTTDNTFAVVLSFASTASIGISRDIFAVNENYKIYNKRCWNNKQIYIGDILPEILDIASIEYPAGTKRNWKILSEGILEIDVDYVEDSNSTATILPNVDVIVRLLRPHVLAQMADLSGLVAGTSGAEAATTMSVSGVTASSTIESGNEFHIENHKQSYVVTANATASTGGIATVTFYPPLEAVASSATVVTFTKSTLKPNEEDIFADLVAARLALNKAPKYFNSISVGGGEVFQKYQTWGERKLSDVLRKLESQAPPKVKHYYSAE